jgi:hypothetical protein
MGGLFAALEFARLIRRKCSPGRLRTSASGHTQRSRRRRPRSCTRSSPKPISPCSARGSTPASSSRRSRRHRARPEHPRGLRDMIALPSDLLRYAQNDSTEQELPLHEELRLLRIHLEILEIRYQARSPAVERGERLRSAAQGRGASAGGALTPGGAGATPGSNGVGRHRTIPREPPRPAREAHPAGALRVVRFAAARPP